MKRNVSDLDFYQCPTLDIDSGKDNRFRHERVMPIIPQKGDGFVENAEPVSRGEKMRKILKKVAIFAAIVLFIVFAVAFVSNNPELFNIETSGKPFWKW